MTAEVEHLVLTRAAARGTFSVAEYLNACDRYIDRHTAAVEGDAQRSLRSSDPVQGADFIPNEDPFPRTATGLTTLMIICHDGLPTQGKSCVCSAVRVLTAQRVRRCGHCIHPIISLTCSLQIPPLLSVASIAIGSVPRFPSHVAPYVSRLYRPYVCRMCRMRQYASLVQSGPLCHS